MTLRFRRYSEVVDNSPPEGWRSKDPPALRGFANLPVHGRAATHTMHYFSIGSGATDCVVRKAIIQRVWRYKRVRFEIGVREIAGPGIIARVTRDPRPYWIQLDVAHAREEVVIRIDECRSVTPFPECSGTVVPAVEVLDVLTSNDLDHRRYAASSRRRDEQMHVIAHEDVCVNRTPCPTTRIVDDVPVHLEVQPVAKNRAAVGSPMNDVKRYTR